MRKRISPKIGYIIAMLIFGTVALPVRGIPMPSGWLAMVRGLAGGLFLLALRRKPDWKAFKTHWLPLVISGVAIGLNWIFLFEAYRYTTVAVATLLYYLAPVLVMLVAPLVLKERLTLKKGGVIAVALAGMVLVSGVFSGGGGSMRGILMGVLAASFYATVMLANRFLTALEPLDRTIFQLCIAGATILPYALGAERFSFRALDWKAVLLLAVLVVVYTGVAYTLYFNGLACLSASSSAVLAYLDPVTALVLSAAVLGEAMSLVQVLGAVLILGALLWSELPERKRM